MIAFLNSFFSYLLLFVVMAVIAGAGVFAGITMRKKKNVSAENKTVDEAQ